jgi:regulator of sirC expression with transglutaminase-like and TPR domain
LAGEVALDTLEAVRYKFFTITERPDEEIDLFDAALLIARTAYPRLDEAVYRRYLDDLTDRLRSRLDGVHRPVAMIEKLNRILFEEEHFQGNRNNYFDPDNSFINRVIDRKCGIPITLSLLYIRVGNGAGLNFSGIPLPGHFISALSYASGRIFIDPFNGGGILSEKECRIMVRGRLGDTSPFDTRRLPSAGPKEILIRMLRNLKAIYLHTNEDMKAFEMLQWILTLAPDAANELRERGMIYEALGNTDRAVADYERYLELSPGAESERVIGPKIERLKRRTTWIH